MESFGGQGGDPPDGRTENLLKVGPTMWEERDEHFTNKFDLEDIYKQGVKI